MDENIKEGEDFLKEVTEEEKEVMIFKKKFPKIDSVHISCGNSVSWKNFTVSIC